jgi:hypothetical protein
MPPGVPASYSKIQICTSVNSVKLQLNSDFKGTDKIHTYLATWLDGGLVMLCNHVLPSKGFSIPLVLFLGYNSMALGSELIAAVPDSTQSTGVGGTKPSPKGSTVANTLPGTQQQSLSPTLDDLFAKVAARVPQFGGMYVNIGQTLEVFLTDTGPSVLAAAREAAIEVFGAERMRRGGFNPILGKYGFLQLQDMHGRARDILALPGVISLDTDERKNRLKVGLSRMEVQADVEKRLAALKIPLEAVIFEKMAPMRMLSWDPDPTDRTRPVVGGTQISVNGGALCRSASLPIELASTALSRPHTVPVFQAW